jgi:hypothetical protein
MTGGEAGTDDGVGSTRRGEVEQAARGKRKIMINKFFIMPPVKDWHKAACAAGLF